MTNSKANTGTAATKSSINLEFLLPKVMPFMILPAIRVIVARIVSNCFGYILTNAVDVRYAEVKYLSDKRSIKRI